MKKLFKIVLCILLVFILIMAGAMFFLSRGLESGSKLTINPVNLSSIKDGIYTGSYNSGRWTNEVNVTVKDHKISRLDVVKDVAIKKPEVTDEVFKRVIDKQNTNIDVVASATVTSKAYLKSIETALNKVNSK